MTRAPLVAALPAASIARAFILFPDPWPKERHKKRRLVARDFLDELARILGDGAELRLATDDMDYARQMLALLTEHGDFRWLAACADDWRLRPADWPPTRYEQKAIAAGRHAALSPLRPPRAVTAPGVAPSRPMDYICKKPIGPALPGRKKGGPQGPPFALGAPLRLCRTRSPSKR